LAFRRDHRLCRQGGELLKKLTAYLLWFEDYRASTDWDEIGEGERACQNPPALEAHDIVAWEWATENVTGFAVEAGLVPGMIAELEMDPDDRPLFVRKVGMIYSTLVKISREDAEAEAELKRKGNE
jgi:hypothetical protein